MIRHRNIHALVLPLAIAALSACDETPAAVAIDAGSSHMTAEAEANAAIATARAGTAAFHRLDAALAADYQEASECVSGPGGAMGFHYANFSIIDGTVDPSAPELLLYEPTRNGGMRLVGVEYMVAAPEWDAVNSGPPALAGRTFDDHRAPGTMHGIPFPHYDLHMWVWKNNPAGMFAHFNPNVSCGD